MAAEAEAAREARAKAIQVSIDEDNHQVVDIKMTISGIGGGKSCKELASSWRGGFSLFCLKYSLFITLPWIQRNDPGYKNFVCFAPEIHAGDVDNAASCIDNFVPFESVDFFSNGKFCDPPPPRWPTSWSGGGQYLRQLCWTFFKSNWPKFCLPSNSNQTTVLKVNFEIIFLSWPRRKNPHQQVFHLTLLLLQALNSISRENNHTVTFTKHHYLCLRLLWPWDDILILQRWSSPCHVTFSTEELDQQIKKKKRKRRGKWTRVSWSQLEYSTNMV